VSFSGFFQFLLKYRKNTTIGQLIANPAPAQATCGQCSIISNRRVRVAAGAAGSPHRTIVCMDRVISLLSRPIAADRRKVVRETLSLRKAA
jgi:hypothetical protein